MTPAESWSVGICLLVTLVVGLVASLFNRGNLDGYFLAGRNMNWVFVGVSLFTSHLGARQYFYVTGALAYSGIGEAVCELVVVFGFLLLGWLFARKYYQAKIFTMPEYLEYRLGGIRIKVYLSVLSLILNIGVKITIELYAAVRIVRYNADTNIYCTLVLLSIAAIYTCTGGLTAVMWTNVFPHMAVITFGCITLAHIGYSQVRGANDGYDTLMAMFSRISANESSAYTSHDPSMIHLFLPASDPHMPWPGTMGVLVCVVFVVAAGQVSVQNVLAARSVGHAQGGVLLAAFLQVAFVCLLVLTGMVARILFPDVVGCFDPVTCKAVCGSPQCSHLAVPYLIHHVMGKWKGVVYMMLMTAHISSLGSDLNASSTIFTMDLWRTARRSATSRELMVVGRLSVLGLFIISVLIVMLGVDLPAFILFQVAPTVTLYLAPSVCAIYLLSVLVPFTTEKGAFWSLMVGLVVGLVRLVLNAVYLPQPYREDLRPVVLKDFQNLHFALFEFLLTAFVCLLVSLLTNNKTYLWGCCRCFTDSSSTPDLDALSNSTVTDVVSTITTTDAVSPITEGMDNPCYDAVNDDIVKGQQYDLNPPDGVNIAIGGEEDKETCFIEIPKSQRPEVKSHYRNKDGATAVSPEAEGGEDDRGPITTDTEVNGDVQEVVQVVATDHSAPDTSQSQAERSSKDQRDIQTNTHCPSHVNMMTCPIKWLCGIERDVTVASASSDDIIRHGYCHWQQALLDSMAVLLFSTFLFFLVYFR